jgi:hypothetical protein
MINGCIKVYKEVRADTNNKVVTLTLAQQLSTITLEMNKLEAQELFRQIGRAIVELKKAERNE